MHRLGNPLSIACPNKSCGAAVGAACRTPGGHLNAHPHMPRLRAVIGSSVDEQRDARLRYLSQILAPLIGREPTAEELSRAQRDGSLKTDKGWIRDLMNEIAPRHRRPTKRTDQNGVTTYWGSVVAERQITPTSWVIVLDTGHEVPMMHNEGWPWATWWPERKREAAELLPPGAIPRYSFDVARNGQLYSIQIEGDAREFPPPAPRVPASKPVDVDQIGLGL